MSPAETERHHRFLRLFTTHEESVRAFVRRLVPSRADADDVMQEVSIVLWEKFESFAQDGDFRAWAFGVARFEVLAWLRDKGRDRLVLDEGVVTKMADEAVALLHTDGWTQDRPGQVHWMVTRHTTMRLALRGNTLAPGSAEQEMFPDSRTSVLPEQGRWVHLAVVYDSAVKTVRFYLNGRFDKESRQAIAHPLRLGAAQIGNWDRQDRKLSGRLDELLLLSRAMTDAEITELFEAGNPYR